MTEQEFQELSESISHEILYALLKGGETKFKEKVTYWMARMIAVGIEEGKKET